MPSFGLPSSIPLSSSPSPCISSLLSSNISSCSESSCAPVLDGCMSSLFENPHLPPPPLLSPSDAAPFSPPPAYPPAFPFGPPLHPSARFPPPPNSSFPQHIPNYSPHYTPEPLRAYERWSDRNISTPYGSDNISKCFSHWPLPTFNSNSNSNFGFLKSDLAFPPVTPYPPLDSVINFSPKFSPLSRDSSVIPNAAVMPSTSSTSIASPLASSHFTSFPPPNLPFDFPLSSTRFPFNPHSSTFAPGLDPSPTFGPCNGEVLPEPVPNYLSRSGAFLPSSSFQTPDHFHDASSRPIHSPETAPRPIMRPSSPSCFFGAHPHPFHGSCIPNPLLSHSTLPRSSAALGPLCSSETAHLHEPSCDFSVPPALPYPPPPPATVLWPYPPSSVGNHDFFRNETSQKGFRRDEERVERIMSETGKLMYQHMSPEEWRWKHYETLYADALDSVGSFPRVSPSAYNHFHDVDRAVFNSFDNLMVKGEGSSLASLKSQREQFDILERSKAQNQSGPSLKLAASALAEMLALGSNGGATQSNRSMLAQIASVSGSALTSDASFPLVNSAIGGHPLQERSPEDSCSSSGSAVHHKDVNDCSFNVRLGGLAEDGFSSGPTLCSPTGGRGNSGQVDEAFCEFGLAPAAWALPKASDQSQSSNNHRSMSWINVAPQSAKGGALHTNGQRRVFSKASAGIIKQPSISNLSTKLHGVNVESSTSESFNYLPRESPNLSPGPQSGRMRGVSSQSLGAPSPEDPTSAVGPFTTKVTGSGLSVIGSHQELSTTGLGSRCPLDSSRNDQWHVNSCGSSLPLSQAYSEPHSFMSGRTTGAASRVLANLKWAGPDGSTQTEGAYLGTSFHLLTASIANLSKVLLSFDSSSLIPPDSAALEETLQSSILRLSECLLLEQSRINTQLVGTHSVGSAATDDSSVSRRGRADGSLTNADLVCQAETDGSTNMRHLKASDVGIMTEANRSGTPADSSHLRIPATTETVDMGCCVPQPRSTQRPDPLNAYIATKYTETDAHNQPHETSERSYSSQLQRPVIDDVIEFLRDNGIFERSSLERLIGAEAREATLKVMVEELKEELELERVENRGTALLCEKIMQEAEVSRVKATRQVEASAESKKPSFDSSRPYSGTSSREITSSTLLGSQQSGAVGSRDRRSHLQFADTGIVLDTLDDSGLEWSCKISSPQLIDNKFDSRSDKEGDSSELPEQIDSVTHSSVDTFQERVESRLAMLRARSAAAATRPSSSSDPSWGVESQPSFHGQPVAIACLSSSHYASGNTDHGGARLPLLLQAGSEIPDANLACDSSVAIDTVQSQMTHLQAQLAVLQSQLSASQKASGSDASKVIDQVESRLAILQARPGWDNELGVFRETEPCTPSNPVVVDADINKGVATGHSLLGLPEEQVAFPRKPLETLSQFTSQLLARSDTLSNTHATLSLLSEVMSKTLGTMSNAEQKEESIDSATKSTHAYNCSQAVETRALLIRSRPATTEVDELESETDFLGGEVGKMCSQSSEGLGSVHHCHDRIETLSEITLVRLLDSDTELSEPLPVRNATSCPSMQGACGDTCTSEAGEFEKHASRGTSPKPQDIEDEAGWEHVGLPLS